MTEEIRHLAQNIIDNLVNNQHIDNIYKETIITICKGIVDLSKKKLEIDKVITLAETDQGAIVVIKKKVGASEIENFKSLLHSRFPDKQFVLVVGENVEIVKI